MRMALTMSRAPLAKEAALELRKQYDFVSPEQADIIVALGGDGFLLRVLHRYLHLDRPVFGMNRGGVGFLMNRYDPQGLEERLRATSNIALRPLRMFARTAQNTAQNTEQTSENGALAFNEVSLLRQKRMAAKLEIRVNDVLRLEELICDGILVATPAGSTAYNMSANGPILPLGSSVIAITPISAFRPRRWRGAILPHDSRVRIVVHEPERRPVNAVADFTETRNAHEIIVEEAHDISRTLLFDHNEDLRERIVKEQFLP